MHYKIDISKSEKKIYLFSIFFYSQCNDETTNNSTTEYKPVKFCDDGAHNRYAPTKQNQICDRRSVLDVILKHSDFHNGDSPSNTIFDPVPKFTYKKRMTTRYVLILDATQDTMVRESWAFLRVAIRNWVLHNLPTNTEVGVIIANDTGTFLQYDISTFSEEKNRNLIASFIPYSPCDSQKPACMSCAIQDAQKMLEKQTIDYGTASSVILIIAPGMDTRTDYETIAKSARNERIKIVTINYPGVIHRRPLDALSQLTSGKSFTLFESKQNSERTFLTTYFDLVNILYNIMVEYYEGNRLDLPMEIHRKKLYDINDDQSAKRRSISGTFLLDDTMRSPSSFLIYTHNIEYPLINSASLTSPSGITYLKKNDERLQMKQLSIEAQINETGSWTYTIDRFNGNPQPHYVQVMATVRKGATSAITANAWIEFKRNKLGNGPIIVFVEVKKGDLPVIDALVEMTIIRPEAQCETPSKCEQMLRIFDTGSGDPDITKGDGIYTRYFNPSQSGTGTYQFDIHVSDNGNTAYSLPSNYKLNEKPCCGSTIPHPSKQPIPAFQRIVPSMTVFVSDQQAQNEMFDTLGRIGDMHLESVDESKIRLLWTAPDMGGLNVARYDVKYAFHVQDIVDSFDTALPWEYDTPLPFTVGDQTAFTMNISIDPTLIGRTLYIAVRPYARLLNDVRPGPISNYVRVHIKPPPPPPVAPASNEHSSSYDGSGNGDTVLGSPYDPTEIEWIVIAIMATVTAIVILCFVAFCYFCLVKRRNRANEKSTKGSICDSDKFTKHPKADKVSTDISNNLIPSLSNGGGIHQIPAPTPMNQDYVYQKTHYDHSTYIICPNDIPDPHIVGLPLYKTDDCSDNQHQQYSIVHELENDSIDKFKDDQNIYRSYGPPQSNTLNRNGRILSPYESWSASQLLHEHERRHSSLDDMINPVDCVDHDMHHNNDDISLIHNGYHKGDRLSIAEPQMSTNSILMNSTSINSPPVPPLPYTTNYSGYPFNYQIYNGTGGQNTQTPSMSNYSMVFRNNDPHQQQMQQMRAKNTNNNNNTASLQGSLCSVHSGSDIKKKTRTITMV